MVRNLLLHLAAAGLFRAKWSVDIHEEWMRNLEEKEGIPRAKLERLRVIMDKAIPDCLVTGYDSLVDGLTLPDTKDRHVLAAAIRCGANVIVTTNLKHFPESALRKFDIVAQHPDDFIVDQIGLKPRTVAIAIVRHKKSLSKSRLTWKQYLHALCRPEIQLKTTHNRISQAGFKMLIADVLRMADWKPS